MMSSNELFYGDSEPVFVVDTAAYPVRRGRVSSYVDPVDKYYGSRVERPGYYNRSYAEPGYYNRGYGDSYAPGAYYPPPTAVATVPTPYDYDSTYYDAKPYEYYDYRKPSTVTLKVPICCESCAEEARNALFELRGVRSVYCDVRKEMIRVTGTAAPADVLQVVRKLHKRSRFWGDDDY